MEAGGGGCLRCAASPARCSLSPFSSLSSPVFLPFSPPHPDSARWLREAPPRMPKVINASRGRPRRARPRPARLGWARPGQPPAPARRSLACPPGLPTAPREPGGSAKAQMRAANKSQGGPIQRQSRPAEPHAGTSFSVPTIPSAPGLSRLNLSRRERAYLGWRMLER